MAKYILQGKTNNVRFTISVGDTTRVVFNQYWAREIELVTIFNVVLFLGRPSRWAGGAISQWLYTVLLISVDYHSDLRVAIAF
jgi:hypothetical protein